jgi:hypothetical protein
VGHEAGAGAEQRHVVAALVHQAQLVGQYGFADVIDIMMVSQLGTTAVAAVGLGNRVFFFNLLVIAGLSGGVSVLAAQYFGRGEMAGVRRSLALALVGALAVSLPFALVYVFSPGSVLGFASQEPALRELVGDGQRPVAAHGHQRRIGGQGVSLPQGRERVIDQLGHALQKEAGRRAGGAAVLELGEQLGFGGAKLLTQGGDVQGHGVQGGQGIKASDASKKKALTRSIVRAGVHQAAVPLAAGMKSGGGGLPADRVSTS